MIVPINPESAPPPSDPEFREGVLRELFRRALETGAKSLTAENLRQAARDLRVPKELLQHLFSQLEEGKSAFYRIAAQEVRRFLESSNIAEELAKALTLLTFEAKVEVRFKPNEKRGSTRPNVSTKVRVHKSEEDSPDEPPTRETTPSGPPDDDATE